MYTNGKGNEGGRLMPLSTEDKVEIQELVARAARCVDRHEVGAWVALFAEDGVFESPAYGEMRGHEEIRDFQARHQEAGEEDGVKHVHTNIIVEGDGERAHAHHYVLKLKVDEAPMIYATGEFFDDLVRTAEGWRFERRRLKIDKGLFARKAAESAAARA
jgi:3-phenylpropionate/cinnamic acid dioxygenase small subunit